MGSVGNQNPWAPYESYKDCTQGVCSIYCPQWCYIVFSPPPPFDLQREDGSATDFSPLIIALIGILASAFVLISYYTIVSKFCRRRNGGGDEEDDDDNNNRSLNGSTDQVNDHTSMQVNNGNGLDDVVIKSITVYKYKKGDVVLVDSTDCSVCLSEFEEDESLRLLPKCNHAFHMLCIDSWLKSHSSCPLCRANISTIHRSDCSSLPETTHGGDAAAAAGGGGGNLVSVSSAFEYQNRNDSVSVIHDLEAGINVHNLVVVDDLPPKTTSSRAQLEIQNAGTRIDRSDHAEQPFLRSVSLNSDFCPSIRVSIADVLLAMEDDEDVDDEDDEGDSGNSTGTGSSEQSDNGEECLSKNDDENGAMSSSIIAMNRSVSTDGFTFARYEFETGRN